MYTLDIKIIKKEIVKYFVFSIICLIFSIIYEMFSHEVYSNFMIFAFSIPLIFGVGFYTLLLKKHKLIQNNISNVLYKMSLYTFTFGSIIKGVLDIYGTTNGLIIIYPIVGTLLFCTSIVFLLFNFRNIK